MSPQPIGADGSAADRSASDAADASSRLTRLRARLRGGPTGNEQLTALTGAVLVILLAALGITIVRIGQLIWLHLFLGLLLIGPVMLKMASTGYRFVLYYSHDASYRRRGPPEKWLRLMAPIVVIMTIGVFCTGVPLLFIRPVNREPLAEIHKIFFIVWLVFTGLHVLGHLPEMARALNGGQDQVPGLGSHAGRGARAITLAAALVAGLVLAIAFIPDFASWTSSASAFHHHHH